MVKIGTHNGSFHCDEALAVFLLRTLDEYKNAEVIRSRDQEKLAECDVVVDVGGVYDPTTHRYDHHQRDFKHTFSEMYTTKLSSAGLVYKHFGRRIIAKQLGWEVEDERIDIMYTKVYEAFIHAIDAIDNGVSRYDVDLPARYHDGTNLSSRVSHLLPWWNEEQDDLDERFQKAVALTGSEFEERVCYLGGAWLPGRALVAKAIEDRYNFHPSGKIVVFENFAPWKDHLFKLEVELGLESNALMYVVYVDDSSGTYRVQGIPTVPGSFKSRLPLPEPWCGLRGDELSTLSTIPDCVFVHASGFIGGNKTREGAIAMASASLELAGLLDGQNQSEVKKLRLE